MDRSTRSLYCLILLGSMATCFALFDPYYRPDPSCSVFRPPIGQDGIRLPPTKRIITYREFDDKVVDRDWFGFVLGTDISTSEDNYQALEVLFRRLIINSQNLVGYYRSFNDSGFFTSEGITLEPITNAANDRAEFRVDYYYMSFFSSDPDSYLWHYYCTFLEDFATPYCLPDQAQITLLVRENPPENIDFEQMGRDLREATCLTMELVPEKFKFLFVLGNLTEPSEPEENRLNYI